MNIRFDTQAETEDQSEAQEFRSVALLLQKQINSPTNGRTVRGSAFQATFVETEDKGDTAIDTPAKDITDRTTKKRKKTGSNARKSRSKRSKKTCTVYGFKGHELAGCWSLFVELRPDDYVFDPDYVKKA